MPLPSTGPSQMAALSEAEEVPSKSALNVAIATAAAAEATLTAAQIATEAFKLSAGVPFPQTASSTNQNKQEKNESLPIQINQESSQSNYPPQSSCQYKTKVREAEDLKMKAAIKIQAAFRGYLVRFLSSILF